MTFFFDRFEAGRFLAKKLRTYCERLDVVVLALPRGGVPVGYEIAKELHAPLDVFLVRKLGVPGNEELAMGAIASGGVRILNDEVVSALQLPEATINSIEHEEQKELERRERLYRGDRPPLNVLSRTVILVDDSLATGASMHAAILALRKQKPARLVVAVPVGSADACHEFKEKVEEIVCGVTPDLFRAVGSWYENFTQLTDEEVAELLERVSLINKSVPEY